VARARLARVLLAQGAADAAWHELEQIPAGASGPLFAEVRGDVLAALGKPDEASAMYTQALTSLAEVGADATAIELKRDALGVGTAAAEAN
jgi:predicted negative regulator of RcsB-dependent stress response